jgi:hypothetical protein
MSAYVCNPEHFGILAAYAVQNRCVVSAWRQSLSADIQVAQRVARELARENLRSVATRYPTDPDGHRPGPGLKDAEIEEVAALYAAYFIQHPQRLKPVQVLRLCAGLDYDGRAIWR